MRRNKPHLSLLGFRSRFRTSSLNISTSFSFVYLLPPLPPPMTSPHPRASVRAARIASHVAPSSLFPLSPSSLCLRPTNMVVATPVEPAKVKQKKNYLDLENSENAYANNTEHVCCDLNAKEGEGIMKGI